MNREGLGGHPDQDTSRAEGKSGPGAGRGTGKNSATEAKGAVRPKDRLRQVRSCRVAQSRRAGECHRALCRDSWDLNLDLLAPGQGLPTGQATLPHDHMDL